MFLGETDSRGCGSLAEEDEEEQVSDSDFAARCHIRRPEVVPHLDDDTVVQQMLASGGGIGRAERAQSPRP